MKLIVGLGNPGAEYAKTRHNVGFEVVTTLAKRWHIRIARRIGRSLVGRAKAHGFELTIMKPLTFMNLSGEVVAYFARREKIDPSEILLVYDDIALPLGKIRIRPGGSAGGHNGMKSIISHLHTNEFPRVRVGIGSASRDVVDHVLSRFHRSERQTAHEAIVLAADAIEMILKDGIEAAMNCYNHRGDGAD